MRWVWRLVRMFGMLAVIGFLFVITGASDTLLLYAHVARLYTQSPDTRLFHQPTYCSIPVDIGVRVEPLFFKNVTGIHSPVTTRSIFPSWSKSDHNASVIIPRFCNRGQNCCVTSTNFPRPTGSSGRAKKVNTSRPSHLFYLLADIIITMHCKIKTKRLSWEWSEIIFLLC